MKRSIRLYFIPLVIVLILATVLSTTFISYHQMKNRHEERLYQILNLMSSSDELEDISFFENAKKAFPHMRITWIQDDGEVLYDSERYADEMDNHGQREEVIGAFETGFGEMTRHSDTIGRDYYYLAKLLDSGNVLRISEMQANLFQSFKRVLLPVLAILLLSVLLVSLLVQMMAKKLVSNLSGQIQMIRDGDDIGEIYPELYPIERTIKDRDEKLNLQLKELEDHKKTIETILSHMSEGIFFIDEEKRILLFNDRAVHLLHKDPERIRVGDSLYGLTRDEGLMRTIEMTSTDDICQVDMRVGQDSIRAYVNSVQGNHSFWGHLVVLRDVTEEHQLERERRQFTSNVTHELRTPLTSINGYGELLAAGKVPSEDVKNIGQIILHEGRRLLRLIDSTMRLSKLEEHRTDEIEDIDVTKMVKDTLALYDPVKEKRDITVRTDLDQVCYTGPRSILEEVCRNIIDNAFKYNVDHGEIVIKLVDEGQHFYFIVSDTGQGIPEEAREKIFQRFYTVDTSRYCKDAHGIGLAMVKHALQSLGGQVSVQSVLGKGSSFKVKIPY